MKRIIFLVCLNAGLITNIKYSIAQRVNEFNGNFSYSVPLMTVPSPYGPGVSIGAGYMSGIGVNHSASEIGLGWGIDMGGMVSRNVSGIPDDWTMANIPDPAQAGCADATGVMYFKDVTGDEEMLDFYKSTYNIDTPAFHFPDYDHYSVSGPGIGGSLSPHLFDYASTRLDYQYNINKPAINYTIDPDDDFTKKMEFKFGGDFAGNFKSRHYPSTPISGSTDIELPGPITDDELTSNPQPYSGYSGYGGGNYGYNATTNRMATAKYVEYFTNAELNNALSTSPNASTIGFINLPFDLNRTSADFDMNGIGAFRITDESGFTYYFTQPAYVNSVTRGNYPLNNDYSVKTYLHGDTTRASCSSTDNYYIKDNALSGSSPFIIEWKQNVRYAYGWLLTAVVGPDFVDDGNGEVDENDKGYWVKYDWQLWTKNYIKRTPEYGFDFSFSSDENDNTKDFAIDDPDKISGKYGTFSKYDQEMYYLNKIQTSSHTAVMVRDVRLDEYSSIPNYYDNQNNANNDHTYEMNYGSTITKDYGNMYDDGGASSVYSNNNRTVTISPSGASQINIVFNSFAIDNDGNDKVEIKRASDDYVLATFSHSAGLPTINQVYSYATGSIKIVMTSNGTTTSAGFRLGWSSNHPTVVPQLKLSRIALFTNGDFDLLSEPDDNAAYNVSTSISAFDVSSSGIGKDKFYNETWYNHANNKTAIESKSLQIIEFEQDYSLARKYASNVKTIVTATDKLTPPNQLASVLYTPTADYESSGKLTLNEINIYNRAYVKTTPSTLFDYNYSSSNDNPDYNPIKIDYWGFYKSDASAQGYSGYTTSTSKDYTDAWSLRKITSPMGATTEIEYESNKYQRVFNGDGTFRGPSKMYMIKEVTLPNDEADYGVKWNYVLEEDITTPSEFTSLLNNPPNGTVKHCYIPYFDNAIYPLSMAIKYINSGTFSFGTNELNTFEKFQLSTYNVNEYANGSTNSDIDPNGDLKYTGNGYIHFQLPLDEEVYGGGPRVKTLTTKNGSDDSYVIEYNYTQGITPMEADRFGEEKQITGNYTDPYYVKLRNAQYDKHRMGPGIGYSTVSIINKGQNNTANGKTTYTFITSDEGIDNFKVNIEDKTGTIPAICQAGSSNCSVCTTYVDTSYIIEVVDKFSGYWGQVKEMQVTDVNDNILSLTRNEFSNLTQGSIVENYDFFSKETFSVGSPGPPVAICELRHHTICIKRNYPVILTKQTVYTQGAEATTEYLKFDEITGAAVLVRNTAPNKSISVTKKLNAFRQSQYSAMGPKSVTSTNKNIVGPVTFEKVTVDSTISGSSDFLSYTVQTFKKDFSVRKYDSGTGKYITDALTDKYWIADRTYTWSGTVGSIDDYGLYKQSELTSAPFDYTLASIDSKWRFVSENTLLDESGHVIEVKGFNDRFAAKKYGHNDTLQIAEASNVNYASFTFCGFEAKVSTPGFSDGEVKMNNGVKSPAVTNVTPHTGVAMVKVPASTTGTSNCPIYAIAYISGTNENKGLQKGRTYRASVWVHSTSPSTAQMTATFPGVTTVTIAKSSSANVTIGNWTQMNLDITVLSSPTTGDELKIYLENPGGSDAYFDDLRVHPVDAGVSATVYEPRTNRVTATLDGNNFATIYKYDAGGRVTEIWQEIEGKGLKLLKKRRYNFSRSL